MANQTTVVFAKSHEEIALELMERILNADGKFLTSNMVTSASKDEIMNAYRQCLKMVKDPYMN